jgi:hypothetical protein
VHARYDAAGLTLGTNRSLPWLIDAPSGRPPDIQLHFGATPRWYHSTPRLVHRSSETTSTGHPLVSVWRSGNGYHFQYADRTNVWVDACGKNIWCVPPPGTAVEDTATYLTGPIFSFVLRLRGVLAFHASAVQVGGVALVIAGPHGAGKSTTAAALASYGCPIVTDDVLRVRRDGVRWVADRFCTPLRLWPAGGALVFGDAVTLPPLTPTWDKRALHLNTLGVKPAAGAVPVGAVAFLGPRGGAASIPRLQRVSPAEALVLLAAHGSAAHLLDARARTNEFLALSDFVRQVPCTRAIAAEDAAMFWNFVDLLYEWSLSPGHGAHP